jgi:stress-induced morphogen
MADLTELTAMIEGALPGATAEIVDQGGGDHLAATVVAPQFAGLSRLEQHRLVYAAVQSRFDDGSIHALALRTRATPSRCPSRRSSTRSRARSRTTGCSST